MTIDPRLSFAFNILLMIVSGVATGAVHFAGLVPDPVAAQIVGWAGIVTFVLSTINTALHGYSGPTEGPLASPATPVPPILTKLGLVLALGFGLMLFGPHAEAASLKVHHVFKHVARRAAVPHAQKLSLNLNQLLRQLQKISLDDLIAAKADADAQKDTVASACYAAIITLVSNQQTALAAQASLPPLHLVMTFQQARDFALALRQGSPLSTACAPLANEVKMDVLNFVAGVTAGTLSLASFGL